MATQTSSEIIEITSVATQSPTQTRSEIEITPVATQIPTQTSLQITDDSTASRLDKDDRNLSWFKVVYQLLTMLVLLLLLVVIGAVPLLVILVLLLMYFAALTLAQLIRHGDEYDKITQLIFVIRFWIYVVSLLFATAEALMYHIAKRVWDIQHIMFLGVSVDDWFVILPVLMFVCNVSFIVNVVLHLVPPIPLEHNETGFSFQEALFRIADCLLLLGGLFVVIIRIHSLKEPIILGLCAYKWIVVLIFVVIGYNVVILWMHLSALFIWKLVGEFDPATMQNMEHKLLAEKLIRREYLVYYCNGLKRSITFVLCSLLTLLTWVLYFRSHLSKTPRTDIILCFGTHTCISLLIYSILSLFKNWVVLSWEASAIYTRLRSQILDSAKQLYFLGILGRHNHDIFDLTYRGLAKRRSFKTLLANVFVMVQEFFTSCHNELYLYPRRLWPIIIAYLSWFILLADPDLHILKFSDKEDYDELGERNDDPLVKKMSMKKRATTRYDLLMHDRTPTAHDIKQVAHYLISTKKSLSEDKIVPSILARLHTTPILSEKLEQLLNGKSNPGGASSNLSELFDGLTNDEPVTQNSSASASPVDENRDFNVVQSPNTAPGVPVIVVQSPNTAPGVPVIVVQSPNTAPGVPVIVVQSSNTAPGLPVTEDDWEYFKKEVLKCEDCSDIFISTWLEKAQNNCLFLANALSSTKEVVDVLNTTVSCLLMGATFILWLLLTDLATTKVFVLIASPLLAAAFIFGETCKTLFQGIMYVYVVHPIHVGDLCSVDDKQLVVKAVGIWITTFCKVEKQGTMEEVTYPNSELATKVVINNLTDFVWEDNLEISLGSIQKSDTKELKKQIQADLDLNEKKDELVSCTHSVAVQEEEDGDFRIIIKLKYTINNIQDWSYTKCKRRKEKLNTDVDELVRKFKETLRPLT